MQTRSLADFFRSEDGQDLIEYAMITAVIGLGLVATLQSVQNDIGNVFSRVENYL
jgi:pilus assembly protein Flp/PilA